MLKGQVKHQHDIDLIWILSNISFKEPKVYIKPYVDPNAEGVTQTPSRPVYQCQHDSGPKYAPNLKEDEEAINSKIKKAEAICSHLQDSEAMYKTEGRLNHVHLKVQTKLQEDVNLELCEGKQSKTKTVKVTRGTRDLSACKVTAHLQMSNPRWR